VKARKLAQGRTFPVESRCREYSTTARSEWWRVGAVSRLLASSWAISIVLGFAAIRRRDLIGHRAWMTRGYAIGLGAATQMLTLMAGS
jgi:hypothetical protein